MEKDPILDLEYAFLEQNIDKINCLFKDFKDENDNKDFSSLLLELKELVSCLCSGEYVAALQTQAAKNLFGTSLDSPEVEDIDVYIKKRIKQYLAQTDDLSSLRQLVVMFVGVACLQLFVQQNWTGPLIDIQTVQYLPEPYEAQRKDGSLQEISLKKISNGESLYTKIEYSTELLLSDILLIEELSQLSQVQSAYVWSLRCLTMKLRVMDEHSNIVMNKIFELIKSVTESTPFLCIEKYRPIACQLHLEIGHLYIHCYDLAKAKEHFTKAQSSLGIHFQLTGALGKRTKFQQDFIAQLKLDVHYDSSGPSSNDVSQTYESIDVKTLPKNVFLDDDTVLDKIKLKDENQVEHNLNSLEIAVIMSFCILSQKSQAMHALTTEELIAYIDNVVSQPKSWTGHTVALHIRSKLEKGSSRKIERSMMQLQVLVDALKEKEPKANVRQMIFYCLPLSPKWTIQDDFAEVLMSLGSVKSALDIYQSLEMWEHVITCFQMLGRYEKAENLIRDQLKEKETSKLWCLLGDVTKDTSCYEKAWEISNHRSARAQRSLGLLHLRSTRYAECIPCFQASLDLNSLQENIWFSMGCAAMMTKNWELAKKAFHRCVSLDTENAKAWNNLSSVYLQLHDRNKAHTVLKEALRANYENWQMWENYLVISTQIKSFNDCILAFHRLMDLKNKYKDAEILGLVVKAVSKGLADNSGRSATRLRPELLKLMGRITSQTTNDPAIWSLYSKLYLMTGDAEDMEKGLNFLVKAHRLTSQAPYWESDVEKFKEIIEMTLHLSDVSTQVSQNKTNPQEAIQVLSSSKLILKQLITKAEKHHTDSSTGQLTPAIVEGIKDVKTKLDIIIESIEALRA